MTFSKWLDTFMSEKNLPDRIFEIEHGGDVHMVESDYVVELAKQSSPQEQSFIKETIVKIDFMNGNVHHFFEHLARCYVQANF